MLLPFVARMVRRLQPTRVAARPLEARVFLDLPTRVMVPREEARCLAVRRGIRVKFVRENCKLVGSCEIATARRRLYFHNIFILNFIIMGFIPAQRASGPCVIGVTGARAIPAATRATRASASCCER